MENLGEKYIGDHNSPIVKLNIGGIKFYLDRESPQAQVFSESRILELEVTLVADNVDRRNVDYIKSARCVAEWSKFYKYTKLIKKVGSTISKFGFDGHDGRFLYPEEALYLIKRNKLELYSNGSPVSMEEATMIYLNLSDCNTLVYNIYHELVQKGFRVFRQIDIVQHNTTIPDFSQAGPSNEGNREEESSPEIRQIQADPYQQEDGSKSPAYYIIPPNFKHDKLLYFKLFVVPQEDFDFDLSKLNDDEIYACYNGSSFFFFGIHRVAINL